jgi:putative peptidoglycan lipid II flippase
VTTVEQVQRVRDYWSAFTGASTNRKIFGAAAIVALLTGLVKLAAVAKELVVAWRFGTADTLDAFFIALLIPSFIVTVVARSFNTVFIPAYILARQQEGAERAQMLLSGASLCLGALLVLMTLANVFGAPFYLPYLASGFGEEKLRLTERLLVITSPVILMKGIISLWAAVLNAGERFALAALSPVVTPVVTIVFLILSQHKGVYALADGLVWGAVLEMILVGVALWRKGVVLLPRWYGLDASLRGVIGQYALILVGVLLLNSADLVDQSMAAVLEPGSVSSLNYGKRINGFLVDLTAVALSTAAIPYFSKLIAERDWLDLRRTLKRSLLMIFVLTVPLSLLFFLLSEFITRTLFQRGSFTPADTELVARVQALYVLQIPFHVAGILMVRLISTMRKNHVLMWAFGVNLVLNIALNYLFMRWLGVAGIALATSCEYFLLFLFAAFFLYRQLDKMGEEFGDA